MGEASGQHYDQEFLLAFIDGAELGWDASVRADAHQKVVCLFEQLETLREVLALCNGDDIRLNGCACTTERSCYLHAKHVAPLLAGLAGPGNAILEVTEINRRVPEDSIPASEPKEA